MVYQEVKYTLKEWLEKISISRRNLGLANRVVRNCVASKRMADLDQEVTVLYAADDTINLLLPALDELLGNAEIALSDHNTGLAYKYLITPERPFDYKYATWVEGATFVLTARDHARATVDAFSSVVAGANPDKVHVYWINAYGFKNYFQTWTHNLSGPSGVWGDIYLLLVNATASTLELELLEWSANEDLIASADSDFTANTEWTLGVWTINAGVLQLAASTAEAPATWATLSSNDAPTFRHRHVYQISCDFGAGAAFASGDGWFRFELGDTIGPMITEVQAVGVSVTQNILATQPVTGGDINLVVRGETGVGDIVEFENIQITEVIPNDLEINVELAWREF